MKTTLLQTWKQLQSPWLLIEPGNGMVLDSSKNWLDVYKHNPSGMSIAELCEQLSAEVPDLQLVLEQGTYCISPWFNGFTAICSLIRDNGEAYIFVYLAQTESNEQAFHNLFYRSVSGTYEIAIDGTVIRCNNAFATILGFDSPNELIGENISSFYYDSSKREQFIEIIKGKESLNNYEILLRRKTGEIIWCIENSYLIHRNDQDIISGTLIDVTEELMATEKYGQVFMESTDAIILVEGTAIADCNKRTEEVLGYSKQELIEANPGEFIYKLIHDSAEKMELFEHRVNKVINGERQRIKLVLRRKDGSTFHSEVSMIPFKILDKPSVQVVIQDISERVLFENTIRESEERFRMLSDVAIEGVVFVEGKEIVDANDQFSRLIGWRTRRDVIGRRIDDFIHSADLDRLLRLIDLGAINRLEVRGNNEAGHGIILEASGSSINYLGKHLHAFLFYDISSRKRTEKALEQSMDRFKGLVENSPNGVFILTDGKVRYANSSGLKLLGYEDEDDIFNHEFLKFFITANRRLLANDLQRIREGEEVEYREVKMIHSNKHHIEVGVKFILTVYDNKPSIQVTVNNLSTERLLVKEKIRAQIAEEINAVLKTEIEEHKKTQNMLREAQKFTRNIIESSLDMIIAVGSDDRITEFNASAQQQFGYSESEILGKDISQIYFSTEDHRRVRADLETKGYFSGEIQNKTKKGKVFTSFLSASLIRDREGNTIGAMGVSRDITEMKRAEEELRESEERFRDIFENVKDFILSIGSEGKIQYSNNSFRDTLGYSEDELKELSFSELCEDKLQGRGGTIFDVLSGQDIGLTLLNREGEKVIVRGEASIRYDKGKPESIRAIFRNVTEAVEQRGKLESIFNSTENILMWTLDKKYRLTSFNKNLRNVWVRDFGGEIRKGNAFLEDLRHKLNDNLYQAQLDNFDVGFTGEPRQFEIPLINKQGDNVWLQCFLNPVYYAGKLEEVSCIAYDITDRKEIDKRIRDALKEKEVLLQEVHHRVKNNLQVISSILNLQTSYVSDEGTLEVLRESQNRIKSMSYIHETLYQTTDFASIEFSEYIRTLSMNLIHSYTTDAPVKLNLDLDKTCLSIDQAIPCGLIVNELVTNALKYAYPDSKQPELNIAVKLNDRNIQLRVKDNGIGLPPEFKYEHSNSLGIQLVYTLVEQLDGKIEMLSGDGTDIIINFEMA